jgi:hypothetical protein
MNLRGKAALLNLSDEKLIRMRHGVCKKNKKQNTSRNHDGLPCG